MNTPSEPGSSYSSPALSARSGHTTTALIAALFLGALVGGAGTYAYSLVNRGGEVSQVVIHSKAVQVAQPAARSTASVPTSASTQPTLVPRRPEPAAEVMPVVTLVVTSPKVEPEPVPDATASVVVPGHVAPEPPPAAEVKGKKTTLKEELIERYKGIKEPARIWPNSKDFAGVSLADLKLFGAMTILDFAKWKMANPEKAARVNRVIRQAFDGDGKSFAPYSASYCASLCRDCTSGSPGDYCDPLDQTAMRWMCKKGATFLFDEKPLRKVLEARLKGNR